MISHLLKAQDCWYILSIEACWLYRAQSISIKCSESVGADSTTICRSVNVVIRLSLLRRQQPLAISSCSDVQCCCRLYTGTV